MDYEPFLTLPVRSCKDLLQVRHQARRIAQLLRFTPEETICIAAGAFAVAEQARASRRRAKVCFAVIDHHLHVFAQLPSGVAPLSNEGYLLRKPLPKNEQQMAAEDVGWLLRQVGQLAPTSPLEEVIRQNQEVLTLLLALGAQQKKEGSTQNPTAA